MNKKNKFLITLLVCLLLSFLWCIYQYCDIKYRAYYFFNVPGVFKQYSAKIIPIQRLCYPKRGKVSDDCIAYSYFKTPYCVSISEEQAKSELNIFVVGDVIAHSDIQLSAFLNKSYNKGKFGGYDWLLRNIKSMISDSDIRIANLESNVDDSIECHGVNNIFNVSTLLLGALADFGFDIMLTANNHAMDNGPKAYENTVGNIIKNKMIPLGYKSDLSNYTSKSGIKMTAGVVECKGFKIGMINYTMLSNKAPANNSNLNFLTFLETERLKQRISDLKKNGAEYVILFIHWGLEYFKVPQEKQKKLATVFFQSGLDVVIGGHSHFIQPMEIINITGNDGKKRSCFIAYSLGNFISHQRGACKYGMSLNLILGKNANGVFLKHLKPQVIKTDIDVVEHLYNNNILTLNTFQVNLSTAEDFVRYIE